MQSRFYRPGGTGASGGVYTGKMQTGREGQNASVRRPGPERGLGGVSPSPLVARAMGSLAIGSPAPRLSPTLFRG